MTSITLFLSAWPGNRYKKQANGSVIVVTIASDEDHATEEDMQILAKVDTRLLFLGLRGRSDFPHSMPSLEF